MTTSQLAILTTFAEDGRRATFSRNFVGGGGVGHCRRIEGKSITAINYTVLADKPESRRSESLPAMFVGDRFEKFIRWEVVDYHGTRSSRPRRMKVGDYCGWLTRAINSEGVSIEDYKKEVKSINCAVRAHRPWLDSRLSLTGEQWALCQGQEPQQVRKTT